MENFTASTLITGYPEFDSLSDMLTLKKLPVKFTTLIVVGATTFVAIIELYREMIATM